MKIGPAKCSISWLSIGMEKRFIAGPTINALNGSCRCGVKGIRKAEPFQNSGIVKTIREILFHLINTPLA